jgi:hypothetical protein
MADVSYVPGKLTAVTGDHCWVLVDAAPDSPAVGWLWQQLGHPVLPELLVGLLGAGFAGATDFALLSAGDDGTRRLFCRGAVTATVDGAGPASGALIEGDRLLTWREHIVSGDASRIVLGSPPEDDVLRLPAAAGVLLAGCVIIELAAPGTRPGLPGHADATDRRKAPPIPAVASRPSPAPRPDTTPRPEAVPHPDTVASGPHADGKPEPSDYPDTITVTSASGWPASGEVAPAGPPAGGTDEEYDYFWGATQARSVADAAIRQAAEGEPDGHRPAFAQTAGVPPVVPAMPGQSPRPAEPRGPEPAPRAPGGLIDAPSWGLGSGSVPAPQEETDFTVRRGALPGLARGAAPPPDKIGPAVAALVCSTGHANPPSEDVCRFCGAPLPADPVVVPRPVLGVLRLSVGDVIALDRGVVMGRAPRADAAGPDGYGGSAGEERPHVVKLPSADGDVSRTHLRVTLDGWHVLVTDLNSTNGTLVTLPGREPQQLRPGEPMPIKPGTVVTLADGIDFRYEVSE